MRVDFLTVSIPFSSKLKAFFLNGEIKVQLLIIPVASVALVMLFMHHYQQGMVIGQR